MTLEHCKYDCGLSATLQPSTDALSGNYFATKSVFFVRGNLYGPCLSWKKGSLRSNFKLSHRPLFTLMAPTLPLDLPAEQTRRFCIALKTFQISQVGGAEMFKVTAIKKFKITLLEPSERGGRC